MTTLHGREAELEQLRGALVAAQNGIPRLILLQGEVGVGKSALLAAFGDAISDAPMRRVRVYETSPGEGGAYEPLLAAVRAAVTWSRYRRFAGPRQARRKRGDLLSEWVGAIPVWGELMGAVGQTVAAIQRRRFPPPEGLDEDLALLLGAARRRTLVLLMDGMERAAEGQASRLVSLFEAAGEGTHLLVVCALAPVPPGQDPAPVERVLPALEADWCIRLRLEDLDVRALHGLVKDRLGAFPAELVPRLHQASGGNPRLALAILDRLAASGDIQPDDPAGSVPDLLPQPLPSNAAALADLDGLPVEVAETLRAASVLGQEFDALPLARVLDADELLMEDHLAMAAAAGVVEARGEATFEGELTTHFRFRSAATRAALLAGVHEEHRRRLEERTRTQTDSEVMQ